MGQNTLKLFAVMLFGLLASCGGRPQPIAQAPGYQGVSAALPEPSAADYAGAARPYIIAPNDQISIEVFGVQELSRKVQVDAAGRLSFPLIGSVDAAGLTPAALARQIEQKLKGRYVKNPQVTVNLEQATNQLLTVDGEVAKPGMFPVVGRMTLIRAVALAGGTQEFAKLDDVVILRQAGGKSYAGLYNLKAIRRGNYADPEVFPNDIVIVGDSRQRRLFHDLLQIVPLLTTPLVLLLKN